MSGNFHEHYVDKHEMPSERSTGLVFAGVAMLVAILYRHNLTVLLGGVAVSSAFGLVSFVAPWMLRPLNMVWFRLAMLMAKIMNPIVMAILYLVAIVPAGLLMQMRSDPLTKKRRPDLRSYWVGREAQATPGSMRNQF